MPAEKPKVKFPESSEASVKLSPFEQKADEKFRDINTLLYVVVIVIVVMVVSALISVGAIVIDQLHFNNLTYREFSESKNDKVELERRITAVENKIDNANQQIIIEQQKQIENLLKKK
ncbi:MAG: hypothetical protein PHO70_05890 [Candidatus Omnitrophica bacterium]|nr:hypothetical protein [Candidatus Omnitrophota bacterium]